MSIYKISNPFFKNDSLLPAFQKEKNHACQCQKHYLEIYFVHFLDICLPFRFQLPDTSTLATLCQEPFLRQLPF